VHYSSSQNGNQYTIENNLAIKVFWKNAGYTGDPAHRNGVNLIEVPIETMRVIRLEMDISRDILPPSHQQDGEWRVGLLNRFNLQEGVFRNQHFVSRRQ
jgi:hypothetical protein